MTILTPFRRRAIAVLALVGAVPASPALAALQDTSRVEELEQRLSILERQLEIQAEEAASKIKDTPVVTASDKGFGLKSAKGDTEIRLTGLAQVDYRAFLDDGNAVRDGFVTRRLRPTVQGSLGKLVGFRITPEFAGSTGTGDSASVVDAYLDLRLHPAATLRVGKQKGLLGLERLQSGGAIVLTERGYATELVPNRDLGVALTGEVAQSTVSYGVGVFNGTADGRDVSVADDGKKEFQARVFFEPFRNNYGPLQGLGFGVAGSTGSKDGSGTNVVARYRSPGQNTFFTANETGITASGTHERLVPQATFYRNSLGVLAEYAVSREQLTRAGIDRTVSAKGYTLVASYVLTGENASYRGVRAAQPYTVGGDGWGAVEVAARIGALDIGDTAFTGTAANRLANPTTQAREARSYGVGVNWHLTANAKLTGDYNVTQFTGGGGGTAAKPLDRRDEKALFTRLTVQY